MNKEIQNFRDEIKNYNSELINLGFTLIAEKIYNPNILEHIFFEIRYVNQNKNKTITFNFYPSTTKLCTNQIEAFITYNSRSIGVSEYLAYKKLGRKLNHGDINNFKFFIESGNTSTSLEINLQKILSVLKNQMRPIVLGDEWISIPIHDPRDDY